MRSHAVVSTDWSLRVPYDSVFYAGQSTASETSAREVIPLVVGALQPRSVVDVGCGVGTWLKAFAEAGVEDLLGIDGDYVERSDLLIPPERFQAHDLSEPLSPDRTWDLAVSLEVGEHLPEAAAATYVASLVALSPCVLFSAAIPHQGGTLHINEQWPSWWARLFAGHGYVAVDVLRPRLWENANIASWYRQNMMFFVDPASPAFERLWALGTSWAGDSPRALVHPGIFETLAQRESAPLPVIAYRRARQRLPEPVKARLRRFVRR